MPVKTIFAILRPNCFVMRCLSSGFFFNVFEKTQAKKNSRSEKTQAVFGQRLNKTEAFSVKN